MMPSIGARRGGSVSIETQEDFEATREKLRQLDAYYEATERNTKLNSLAREDILRTTKRLINQLKEEMTWFKAHASAKSKTEN